MWARESFSHVLLLLLLHLIVFRGQKNLIIFWFYSSGYFLLSTYTIWAFRLKFYRHMIDGQLYELDKNAQNVFLSKLHWKVSGVNSSFSKVLEKNQKLEIVEGGGEKTGYRDIHIELLRRKRKRKSEWMKDGWLPKRWIPLAIMFLMW